MAYTRELLADARMAAEAALSAARGAAPAEETTEAPMQASAHADDAARASAREPANLFASDAVCMPPTTDRLPAALADAVICMARHTRRLEQALAAADADGAAEAATHRAEALDQLLAAECPPDVLPVLAEVLVAALDKTRELDQTARALRESTRTELRTSSVNTRLARAYTP